MEAADVHAAGDLPQAPLIGAVEDTQVERILRALGDHGVGGLDDPGFEHAALRGKAIVGALVQTAHAPQRVEVTTNGRPISILSRCAARADVQKCAWTMSYVLEPRSTKSSIHSANGDMNGSSCSLGTRRGGPASTCTMRTRGPQSTIVGVSADSRRVKTSTAWPRCANWRARYATYTFWPPLS